MKTIGNYFFGLTRQHQFAPFFKFSCYSKFISLLPPRFKNAINYITTKNDTLLIALSHPGFKIEIDNNRDLLKSLLKDISKYDSSCNFSNITQITTFISNFNALNHQNENKDETIPYYEELSDGEFDIEHIDDDLKAIFEKIKQDIKCNKS
ncbi:MAG: hypothetical protein PHI79_02745 [Sulfurovaceae bacterium]|jgi:hypothetical protein|nr:hypothetical protein [Sulfurovaceae bacterium]MDD5548497.1 hypothetical protein [Sulfurovaceae bacterium]